MKDDEARITASAVAGVRHLLLEEQVWADVRAELERRPGGAAIAHELAVDPTKVEWVSAHHYAAMMDALLAATGPERTFALGRARLHRTAQAGAFAPVVRSWTRSFGRDAGEFLRLTLHAWNTQTRNLGTFVLDETRPGHARFVLARASDVIGASAGWQCFLSGYGTGLLDLLHVDGTCAIRSVGVDVEIVYDYATDGTPTPPRGV